MIDVRQHVEPPEIRQTEHIVNEKVSGPYELQPCCLPETSPNRAFEFVTREMISLARSFAKREHASGA
jgi:hypothetical protein